MRQGLLTIDVQSQKLARLVDHLLDVSRIEAGRLTLTRSVVDLMPLVRGVVETAQATTSRHTIAVYGPDEARALADPLRLEQVLTNLLDNAIKYSPDGGPVEVHVAVPTADAVQIAVRDRGMGIAPEHWPYIFDRFYQAHAERYASGMGLGLYISRQIVELHGGRIEAEFPPDGGSRFVITLPTGRARAPVHRDDAGVV